MIENIHINSHNSIQINDMFFDPFQINENLGIAKYIFLTHTHYDHLSIDDIKKVSDSNTVLFATHDAKEKLEHDFKDNKIIYVEPNESFEFDNVKVETFPSYNINKNFHKKEYEWVGYKITRNGVSYAVIGDSDATPELENLKCDVLFVPVGGTYTMTAQEAASLVNIIKPKLVIPTHYGSVVGTKHDGQAFSELIDSDIECTLLI